MRGPASFFVISLRDGQSVPAIKRCTRCLSVTSPELTHLRLTGRSTLKGTEFEICGGFRKFCHPAQPRRGFASSALGFSPGRGSDQCAISFAPYSSWIPGNARGGVTPFRDFPRSGGQIGELPTGSSGPLRCRATSSPDADCAALAGRTWRTASFSTRVSYPRKEASFQWLFAAGCRSRCWSRSACHVSFLSRRAPMA